MRTTLRRAVLGLTSAALVGSTLGSGPAQANARTDRSSDWLATQLDNGVVHNDQWDFDDVGLTLDVYFAFDDLGERRRLRGRIIDAVESRVDSYVGSGATGYAGAHGKLVTALHAQGVDPASYADGDLVPTLKGLVVTAKGDPERGRAKDAYDPADPWGADYSNTIGQSWVVRAFAQDGARRMTKLTTRFMLRQQCGAGFFREDMDATGARCDAGSTPSVDATALGVLALKEARRAGVGRLGDDIRDALRWLRRNQNRNGSFTGNGVPNANSTGLAAVVLADSRFSAAAERAARWIARRQVTPAKARGSQLVDEVGAIAYNAAAFRQGAEEGITTESRDQWRRATAQAAAGLRALG